MFDFDYDCDDLEFTFYSEWTISVLSTSELANLALSIAQ